MLLACESWSVLQTTHCSAFVSHGHWCRLVLGLLLWHGHCCRLVLVLLLWHGHCCRLVLVLLLWHGHCCRLVLFLLVPWSLLYTSLCAVCMSLSQLVCLFPVKWTCFCHMSGYSSYIRGVTKRCRLSWLTNSALVYEPKCGVRRGVAGSQPMSTAVQCAVCTMHMEPK